jgi:excisionase family DNA binding protein
MSTDIPNGMETIVVQTMARPRPERLLYRVEEAAEAMGVSRTTVYELVWAGELATVKIGKRGQRIPVDEIRRWISENVEGGRV